MPCAGEVYHIVRRHLLTNACLTKINVLAWVAADVLQHLHATTAAIRQQTRSQTMERVLPGLRLMSCSICMKSGWPRKARVCGQNAKGRRSA